MRLWTELTNDEKLIVNKFHDDLANEMGGPPTLDDLLTGDWSEVPEFAKDRPDLWEFVQPQLMEDYSPEEVTRFTEGRAMEEDWEADSIYGRPDEDGR